MSDFCVSIVLFDTGRSILERTLSTLVTAINKLDDAVKVCIFIVNNGTSSADQSYDFNNESRVKFNIISGQGNIGYGSGHNLAISKSNFTYFLVLNPDVELAEDSLQKALDFMQANLDCALLVPKAIWPNGSTQYLCKRYPSVFNLFLRGFAPSWLREIFNARLARYEMRDVIGEDVVWDPPIVSGCFMLFRSSVLKQLRGFDSRYFLYFEDFDLSLRVGKVARVAYVPSVKIIHRGGNTAKKGWRHIWYFIRSAFLFFKIHGWKWW